MAALLELVAYARLARLSHERQQLGPRDKFLVLTAVAADQLALPSLAARCRQLVLDHNPQHLLGHYETVGGAGCAPPFQAFLQQLRKFCSFERAEHLLSQLQLDEDLDGGIPLAERELAGLAAEPRT